MPPEAHSPRRHLLGVISDTHGTLDARVADVFAGVDRILHAGDVGRQQVLWELQTIAPVTSVAGNVDRWEPSADELPGLQSMVVGGLRVALIHVRGELPRHVADESDIVVFGHSHLPLVDRQAGVLWVNPGSATQPRRSPIGRSVALIEITEGGTADARIVPLPEYEER